MSRRTITVPDIENTHHQYMGIEPLRPDPHDYVSHLCEGGPFEHLLWREIKHIIKKSGMTDWQGAIFQCYLHGLSIRQTALIYQRSESTIHQHLSAAFEKAKRCPHRGVLTVMIETLGWPAVRESLADKLEMRLKQSI